jgi:hypothetical protein
VVDLDLSAQTCPRRVEGPKYDVTGEDTWRPGHSLSPADEPAGPSCSYCGSLHPARFMELVHAGWVVGPTDKTYKAYLQVPLTDEDKATRRRQFDEGKVAQAIRGVGERDGKTPEQIQADLDAHWDATVAPIAEGRTVAKFYFQHLDEAQKREFVDLINARAVAIGYPGRFYVPPFFVAYGPPATGETTA